MAFKATFINDYDRAVLSVNPWGMDDSDYRVLNNRMLTTRVAHDCAICFESIDIGLRVRAQRETCDGTVKTFYFCDGCCHAMAALGSELDPDGDQLSLRYEIGRWRAEMTRGQVPPASDPHDNQIHQWEGEGGR